MKIADFQPIIEIRPITQTQNAELRAVEDLQQEVWGLGEREIVSFMMLIPTLAVGGVLLGAFDGAKLVGFAYAFAGHSYGRRTLHSDMLAVKPAYRDANIGYRLKLAQRDAALQRGVRLITWTFDPLQTRNAHLNFAKLGVTSQSYRRDFYGGSSSPLHTGGTDRLWVDWHLPSARVVRKLAQTPAPHAKILAKTQTCLTLAADGAPRLSENIAPLTNKYLRLEVPLSLADWQRTRPELFAQWRAATRQAFERALANNYRVIDFLRDTDAQRGVYLLDSIKRSSQYPER